MYDIKKEKMTALNIPKRDAEGIASCKFSWKCFFGMQMKSRGKVAIYTYNWQTGEQKRKLHRVK